jgi:vacuolar-type H+-ATPase subunit D/Vma8
MLSRVGEMIKSDTRKINAITEMMLPAMNRRIKYIERVA